MEQLTSVSDDLIKALQCIAHGRRSDAAKRRMPRWELQKIAQDILFKHKIDWQ